MKYSKNICISLVLIIIQSNIIAQNDIQVTEFIYSLSDTTKALEYYTAGREYLNKAKYDSSIALFQKATDIYKDLLQQNDEYKFWVKYIQTKNYIGYNLCYLGRYDESIRYLSGALALCLDKLGEDNLTAAQIYQSSGIYYDFTEDLNKSLEMFQKALGIRINLLGETHSDVADTYNSIGIIYSKRSNKDKALEYFLKALAIKKNLFGDEHTSTAASYNNIGINYFDRGDYGKAIEFYQRSLNIRLKVLGEQHHLTASSYNNLGNCYQNIKEYDNAEENHLKSLAIRKNVLGDKHDLVATSYNNLGLVYWKKNEPGKALDYFKQALDIRIEKFKQNHPSIAQSYMNIGLIYYDNKDYDKAIEQYNKSLQIWKNLGESKRTEISKIYQNISESYIGKTKFDSALIAIQKSIIESVLDFDDNNTDANPRLNYVQSEVQLLNSFKIKSKILIEIAKDKKQDKVKQAEVLNKSLEVMELADSLIDKLNMGFKSESSKYFLGENTSSIYEHAVETALRLYKLTGNLYYKEKLFYFIEKSKAAVLQQGIHESKAKLFANISPDILDKEKYLKDELLFYDSQLQLEIQKKDNRDSVKIFNYQSKVFELNNQYEKLIAQIENDYPVYFNLKYKSRIKTPSEIQKLISDDSVILNYFVGSNTIYIAEIEKNNFEIKVIDKPEDFDRTVKLFYSSIVKVDNPSYIKSSNQLSKLLIEPVESLIMRKKKVIIIPHDVLFKLPFEAMFTSQQKNSSKKFSELDYLIKNYDVSYHYSANLFADRLMDLKNNFDKKEFSKNFIGFAPVFPKDNSLGYTISNINTPNLFAGNDNILRSVSVDGKTYDELKYSEWEVNSIIDLFAKSSSYKMNTAYFYADAKEDTFKANVKDYKIVHIASHSFMNEEQPDISGIIFSQPTDSSINNDGILYASETYSLNLNADLVVLSSCESGLGKLFKGEGMIALNRGLLHSGASNIIFSLWKISDKHTSELMVEFYRQMISEKNYSESLRLAKLKLIKNEATARPRSWAGFLLIGVE